MTRTRAEVWYTAMIFCFTVSSVVFVLIAKRGATLEAYAIPVMVGMWAPVFGILGIRAQLLRIMGISVNAPAPDDARAMRREHGV